MMNEERICILPIIDGMASFMTGNVEVQVRERIVRCRDCKHMHVVRQWSDINMEECWLHASSETGALGKVLTEPDGFCKWGEPKASS